MKLLSEFSDEIVGGAFDPDIKYAIRKATRVVLQRGDGKIAVLYNGKGDYHKFAGGGIEVGEDIAQGLQREVKEEVGCSCLIERELGCIIEYRVQFSELQLNYCYFATTDEKIFHPNFTQKELDEGFELKRFERAELKTLFSSDSPVSYVGKFINHREKIIIGTL